MAGVSLPGVGTEDAAKAARRRQILAAATTVFAEHGYHGASVSHVIERAQIARGTFYLYFASKEAVFASILDQALSDLRGLIHRVDVSVGAAAPALQVRAQLVASLNYVVGDRALARLLLRAGHTPDADAAERLDRFWREVHQLLVLALTTGQGLGLVRPCRVEVTAAALLGMTRGVVEQLILQPDTCSVPDAADELLGVALRGVVALAATSPIPPP